MNETEYKKIIALAIEGEIEAHNFYKEASERLADPFLKKMFAEFAEEEKRHRMALESIQQQPVFTGYFSDTTDFKVSETVDKPTLSIDMKPADAIALAMKNEEEAMVQYTAMAEACSDPEQKAVFADLAAMERNHKRRMENAFVDIAYPEVW
jgi:rubrerythrin